MRIAARIALGVAVSGALLAAPVTAQSYRGYYGGGSGGYYHHGNGGDIAAALIGGLLVGGLVGAIASSSNNSRPQGYTQQRYAPQGYGGQTYSNQGYVQQNYATPSYAQPNYAQPTYVATRSNGDAASAQVEMCSRAAERNAQQYGGMARVVSIEAVNGSEASAEVRGTLEISSQQYGSNNRAAFTCSASYDRVTGLRLG